MYLVNKFSPIFRFSIVSNLEHKKRCEEDLLETSTKKAAEERSNFAPYKPLELAAQCSVLGHLPKKRMVLKVSRIGICASNQSNSSLKPHKQASMCCC